MTYLIRRAVPSDVREIVQLTKPLAEQRILIAKDMIAYFEDVQEFVVAEADGHVIGCGALHVFWEDIAEVRTIAVAKEYIGKGIGAKLLTTLLTRAKELGLQRVFCLTFETKFFSRFGFNEIEGTPVGQDIYEQMLRSHDDGVAEFLELARVKPNTLGNTRMMVEFN